MIPTPCPKEGCIGRLEHPADMPAPVLYCPKAPPSLVYLVSPDNVAGPDTCPLFRNAGR